MGTPDTLKAISFDRDGTPRDFEGGTKGSLGEVIEQLTRLGHAAERGHDDRHQGPGSRRASRESNGPEHRHRRGRGARHFIRVPAAGNAAALDITGIQARHDKRSIPGLCAVSWVRKDGIH